MSSRSPRIDITVSHIQFSGQLPVNFPNFCQTVFDCEFNDTPFVAVRLLVWSGKKRIHWQFYICDDRLKNMFQRCNTSIGLIQPPPFPLFSSPSFLSPSFLSPSFFPSISLYTKDCTFEECAMFADANPPLPSIFHFLRLGLILVLLQLFTFR